MLDRTQRPVASSLERIEIDWPSLHLLSNDIPLYLLRTPTQRLLEVELVFRSGSTYEAIQGASFFTAALFTEGTHRRTGQEIASYIDFYGATLTAKAQADFFLIQLICHQKHLEPMLLLLEEMLFDLSFPLDAFTLIQSVKKQEIAVSLEKNNQIARKAFFESIFGKKTRYGYRLELADVDLIQQEDLVSYYTKGLFWDPIFFITGPFEERYLLLLENFSKSFRPVQDRPSQLIPAFMEGLPVTKENVKGPHSLQASICLGKSLITKNEEDYLPLSIVVELLGGYFGSRLMRNIREDKGYTYSIYALLSSFVQKGYFLIETEVDQKAVIPTVKEIKKELQLLREETPTPSEWALVKQHMIGRFLSEIGDPFSVMHLFQQSILYHLKSHYTDLFFDTIYTISEKDVRNLVEKYLSLDTLHEIVVY